MKIIAAIESFLLTSVLFVLIRHFIPSLGATEQSLDELLGPLISFAMVFFVIVAPIITRIYAKAPSVWGKGAFVGFLGSLIICFFIGLMYLGAAFSFDGGSCAACRGPSCNQTILFFMFAGELFAMKLKKLFQSEAKAPPIPSAPSSG